jgi:hypothetical protein
VNNIDETLMAKFESKEWAQTFDFTKDPNIVRGPDYRNPITALLYLSYKQGYLNGVNDMLSKTSSSFS